MSCLAVIPARGGSKGIIKKNLQIVGQLSLVARAVEFANGLDWCSTVFCSTDDNTIMEEALAHGADVPALRPESLSGDLVGDKEVLDHAVRLYEKMGVDFRYVAMFQPTCPTRTKEEADACFVRLQKGDVQMVCTVTEVDKKYHPLKQIRYRQEASLYCEQGAQIIARQQLDNTYIRNGSCYVFTKERILSDLPLFSESFGIRVSDKDHVNIDSHEDLRLARRILG